MPDDLTATLEEIKERWSKVERVELKPEVVPEPGYQTPWLPDVDHLVKAVEAVLKLADDWKAKADEIGGQIALEDCDGATAGFKMIGSQTHRNHATALRETVTRALNGDTDG
jgi:hypothetical protein